MYYDVLWCVFEFVLRCVLWCVFEFVPGCVVYLNLYQDVLCI